MRNVLVSAHAAGLIIKRPKGGVDYGKHAHKYGASCVPCDNGPGLQQLLSLSLPWPPRIRRTLIVQEQLAAITTVVQDRRAPAGDGDTPSGKCGKGWLASGPGWRTRLSAYKSKGK